jgi:fucose permease
VINFNRDRFTWFAYLLLAYFAYLQASVGPLMPFLRAELSFNYTVAGLHLSALALGMILAGISCDWLVRHHSRKFVLWLGVVGMALGALGLAFGQFVIFTMGSMLMMGWLGSFVLIMVQATLSDHHGKMRAIAITESNVTASISASLAPFFVGQMQAAGIGWQGALYLGVLWVAVMAVIFGRQSIPVAKTAPASTHTPTALPAVFWAYALVVFLAVSVEWSVIFWGAEFLEIMVGLTRVNAATVMSVFFVAMIFGRIIGTRLTHRYNVQPLLLGALCLALFGFPVFWLSSIAVVNIAGLFITGLGVANLFPLTLSIAIGAGNDQSDKASARISLVAGGAILVSPFVLGWLGDRYSINMAYAVIPLFLLAALGSVVMAGRLHTEG